MWFAVRDAFRMLPKNKCPESDRHYFSNITAQVDAASCFLQQFLSNVGSHSTLARLHTLFPLLAVVVATGACFASSLKCQCCAVPQAGNSSVAILIVCLAARVDIARHISKPPEKYSWTGLVNPTHLVMYLNGWRR
jgi:hypothetical protein